MSTNLVIAIAAKVRDEWKMLTIRQQENRHRRVIRIYELASEHRVPQEALIEGAPGIYRSCHGERFLFHNDQLTQLTGALQ